MASSEAGKPNKNPHPTLIELDKPEKLSNVLKQDYVDCMSCRLMGSAAMFGLAAYIFISGRRSLLARKPQIIKQKGTPDSLGYRIMGLGTLSGAFVAMGIYRLVN